MNRRGFIGRAAAAVAAVAVGAAAKPGRARPPIPPEIDTVVLREGRWLHGPERFEVTLCDVAHRGHAREGREDYWMAVNERGNHELGGCEVTPEALADAIERWRRPADGWGAGPLIRQDYF